VSVGFARAIKVALTLRSEVSVTTQFPIPTQPPPLQPMKEEPLAALAESVTTVPFGKVFEQVPGQMIPAGELSTVPWPVPCRDTESVGKTLVNIAATVVFAFKVRTQVPTPVHGPLHPAKLELGSANAVRVTMVPGRKFAIQPVGFELEQSIPGGTLVTVPVPVPERFT
jgi:hypothetical protein